MGAVAGALYGAGYTKAGNFVKRAGQIATDPFGNNPKGKTVVDAGGNMFTTVKGVPQWTPPKAETGGGSTPPTAPEAPKSLADVAKSFANGGAKGAATNDAKIAAQIGKGWDDTGDEFVATGKALDTSKNYIGNLGKVRDQFQTSLDAYKEKTDAAITGNKTLIDRNQNKDLTTLAGDTRRNIDNTNVMLGTVGATRGSAGKVAARILSADAGKQRASLLTTYGDQQSEQDQASLKAIDDYHVKISEADDWVKTQRQIAMDEYTTSKEALDRLKNKKSGWKKDDINAANTNNLNKLMGNLASIQAKATNFQMQLAQTLQAFGGQASALDSAAVDVTPPAELNTPAFKDTAIDINNPATDWFDPNAPAKPEKVIKGYDALGNPIYADANIDAAAITA